LPIKTCGKERQTKEKGETCDLCKKTVDIKITTGDKLCKSLAPHGPITNSNVVPFSLHERCLFLSDMIRNIENDLKTEYLKNVCSCAGCCDEGECYFAESSDSHEWITSQLIELERHILDEYL
jgi:hypothetical protein